MDLLTAMRMFTRDARYRSIFLGEDISPKQRQGALAFAPYGAEQPLALIDESMLRGGKEGMLFTDAAFYQSNPARRVPLAAFRGLAAKDASSIQAGGERIALMKLNLDGAVDAVRGLFNAVSMVNNGDTDMVLPPLPLVGGAVQKVAHQHLIHPAIHFPGDLEAGVLRNVVSSVRGPLDALCGERVVGLINDSLSGWEDAVIVTSTHLASKLLSEHAIVPYSTLSQVTLSPGTLSTSVTLLTTRGKVEITLRSKPEAARQLAAFLQGLLALPPQLRVGGAFDLETDLDPSGAISAMTRCTPPEARSATLLQLIAGATRKQLIPAGAALDLAHRASLLHTTLATGHSTHQGALLSALPEADLQYALQALLGQPLGRQPHPPFTTLDFNIQGPSGAGKALASSAVGLLAMATLGVGWVSVPGRQVRGLRVTTGAVGHFTGFTLLGMIDKQPVPLSQASPEMHHRLLGALASIEAQLLLCRTLVGWGAPPWDLLAMPLPQLAATARQMADFPISLEPFTRG